MKPFTVLLFAGLVAGVNLYPDSWTKEKIDTTAGADYLSDVERQLVIEINMVRTDPARYARDYLVPVRQYYRGRLLSYPGRTPIRTSEGVLPLDECIRALLASKPVRPLAPAKGLTLAARDHARDQAKSGGTGHTGSDGSAPNVRMDRYGAWDISAGENIDYGNALARQIVASLLTDDGVPSRGHRKNLLDPSFTVVGLAVGPHPVYGNMCVIDFAGAYR